VHDHRNRPLQVDEVPEPAVGRDQGERERDGEQEAGERGGAAMEEGLLDVFHSARRRRGDQAVPGMGSGVCTGVFSRW